MTGWAKWAEEVLVLAAAKEKRHEDKQEAYAVRAQQGWENLLASSVIKAAIKVGLLRWSAGASTPTLVTEGDYGLVATRFCCMIWQTNWRAQSKWRTLTHNDFIAATEKYLHAYRAELEKQVKP